MAILDMWTVWCPDGCQPELGPMFCLIAAAELRAHIVTANGRGDLATRLLLQECQSCHLPADDDTQPLPVALQEQEDHVHGQVSLQIHATISPPFPWFRPRTSIK